MTVAFVTFGCRLNQAEALATEAAYRAAGWTVRAKPPADRIIVRGCSVTARAERDVRHTIARLRGKFPQSDIFVTGCFPERTPPPPLLKGSEPSRGIPASRSRAYLKVQDGCSGHCTFCIVPHFRGAPRSVPFADVLAQADAFLAAGFTELVVTGCNLALYRTPEGGLADLLDALATRPSPGHRIRLGSLEPGLCDTPLLAAFAAHPNLCPFLHLSLQSASPRILAAMRRPYEIEAVARFLNAARACLGPRTLFGADVITGFPGETEEDFLATRTFLAQQDVALVHAFPYSERPGTPAATMLPRIPPTVRRARQRLLAQEAAERKRRFAAALSGTDVTVCIERDGRSGLTAEGLRAELSATHPRRTLVTARVTGCTPDATLVCADAHC